jgi:hypothetical protein
MLISNPLNMFHKNSHTKSYKQNKFTNMSNHHIFVNNFFLYGIFSMDSINFACLRYLSEHKHKDLKIYFMRQSL